jgi:pyridoxal biosynthesis lyase PdxS
MWQIAREAITNVERHSQAKNLTVTVNETTTSASISVVTTGSGSVCIPAEPTVMASLACVSVRPESGLSFRSAHPCVVARRFKFICALTTGDNVGTLGNPGR